jgi:hypothetical protein
MGQGEPVALGRERDAAHRRGGGEGLVPALVVSGRLGLARAPGSVPAAAHGERVDPALACASVAVAPSGPVTAIRPSSPARDEPLAVAGGDEDPGVGWACVRWVARPSKQDGASPRAKGMA